MLEPLVNVFDVTFAEIILGERAVHGMAGTEAVVNKTEESIGLTGVSEGDKTEAAIKAVIDEAIGRKEKNVRRTIAMIAAAMAVLAVIFFAIIIVRQKQNTPTLDISGLTRVSRISARMDEEPITVGDTVYVAYTFVNADAFGNLMKGLGISDPAKLGTVIAYSPKSPQGWTYYCTLEGTNDGWLLMFDDDKTGGPNAKNAIYLYCTQENLEQVPDWVKGLHDR